MVSLKKSKGSFYPNTTADAAEGVSEHLQFQTLDSYLNGKEARVHNVAVRETVFENIAKSYEQGGAGRIKEEHRNNREEAFRQKNKIRVRETAAQNLLAKFKTAVAHGAQVVDGAVTIDTRYKTKHNRRCRRQLNGVGVQNLVKALQAVVIPDTVELDLQSAQFLVGTDYR